MMLFKLSPGRKPDPVEKWPDRFCLQCGKKFDKNKYQNRAQYMSRRFCSQTCGNKSHMKVLAINREIKQQTRETWPEKYCVHCGEVIDRYKFSKRMNYMSAQFCRNSCRKLFNNPDEQTSKEIAEWYERKHLENCREFMRTLEMEVRRRATQIMIDQIRGRIEAPGDFRGRHKG